MSEDFEGVDPLSEVLNRKAAGRTPNTPGSEDPKKRFRDGISRRALHIDGKREDLASMMEDLKGHPNAARWASPKYASRIPKF